MSIKDINQSFQQKNLSEHLNSKQELSWSLTITVCLS